MGKINTLYTSVFLVAFLLLSGCTSNPASLDREALKQAPINTVHIAATEKLGYELSSSGSTATAAMGGGLLGGLIGAGIDAAVNSRRHNAMVPVVAALKEYNVEQQLTHKLKTLKGPSFASVVSVTSVDKIDEPTVKVLRIGASSYLGATHQHVTTQAFIKMKPSDKSETEYHRTFQESVAIDFGGKVGINATQYLVSKPEKLRAAIDQSLNAIVKQIEDDLNTAPPTKK